MVVFVKKRTLFLIGVLVAGIAGLIGNHFRAGSSQRDSLLVNTAKADAPSCGGACDLTNWTQEQCDCYYCGICSGSGSDGCCSGPTNDVGTGVDASTDAGGGCADAADEGGTGDGSGGGGGSGSDEGG